MRLHEINEACCPGYEQKGMKKKGNRQVPNCVPVKEEDNPIDVIKLDVPLFIRLLEYAREDAKSDADLHHVTDQLIELAAAGEVLTMDQYNAIMAKQLDEAGKDACYNKVKSRYKIWPSAYASGALVRCRKVGAANWGNKSKK